MIKTTTAAMTRDDVPTSNITGQLLATVLTSAGVYHFAPPRSGCQTSLPGQSGSHVKTMSRSSRDTSRTVSRPFSGGLPSLHRIRDSSRSACRRQNAPPGSSDGGVSRATRSTASGSIATVTVDSTPSGKCLT